MEDKLPGGIYGLCDDSLRPELPLVEKARAMLEGGVRVVQLRMKRIGDREALAAARAVVEACRRLGAVCVVNDRVDWALLSGADGVHLGDDDLAPADARKLLGPNALIGVTCRSLQAIRAVAAVADYAGVGPVFPTSTKQVDAPVLGVERLAEIARDSPLPVVAISGIKLENVASVARAGVRCAAVASDLLLADDIAARARSLREAFASK